MNVQNLGVRSLILSGAQALTRLVTFAWIVYLSRSVGPEIFGWYTIIMGYVGLLLPLTDLGIGVSAIRDIAQDHRRGPEWTGSVLLLRLMFGVLCAAGLVWACQLPQYANIPRALFLLGALHLLINTLGNVSEVVFVAYERQLFYALATVFAAAGWVFWGAIALRVTHQLVWVFAAMLLNTCLTAALQLTLMTRYFLVPRFSWSPANWRYQIKEGLPIGGTSILSTASERIDRILLSLFRSESAVGQYGAATLLTSPILEIVWNPLSMVLFPIIFRTQASEKTDLRWLTEKILLWGGGFSLPIAVLGSFLSRYFIPALFGHRYDASAPLFSIALWALPFLIWNRYMFGLFVAFKKQTVFLGLSAAACLVNVGGNLWAIPHYGALGAAQMTVITQGLLSLLGYHLIRKLIPPLRDPQLFGRLFITTAAGAIPLLIPGIGRVPAASLSFLVFAFVTYGWVFQPEDRHLIERWLGRVSPGRLKARLK